MGLKRSHIQDGVQNSNLMWRWLQHDVLYNTCQLVTPINMQRETRVISCGNKNGLTMFKVHQLMLTITYLNGCCIASICGEDVITSQNQSSTFAVNGRKSPSAMQGSRPHQLRSTLNFDITSFSLSRCSWFGEL